MCKLKKTGLENEEEVFGIKAEDLQEEEFFVETILDKRYIGNSKEPEYFIKWKGFPK